MYALSGSGTNFDLTVRNPSGAEFVQCICGTGANQQRSRTPV
ncbi:hypothetical protein GCM10009733_080180 [Nonomuraea maheshkhaliensis]|uniref:Uncharacterized protein n=1 Tax=Nonomuraea maheshkhaliensis TaxID=419590 RepID=A0ABP4SEM9_9ACTN